MKKIVTMFLTLVAATNLFAQTADPSPADQGKPGPPLIRRQLKNWFWDRLNLAEDQKEKMRQIREADRESLRTAWAKVAIAKELLKAALLANPENTADIQTKATDLANALSASSVQMALHLAKIGEVLTPVQRVELEEAMSRRMYNWRQHLGGLMEDLSKDQYPWQRKDQSPQEPPAAPQGGG
jgi:Spy/CpxP family protein refolding chaperone